MAVEIRHAKLESWFLAIPDRLPLLLEKRADALLSLTVPDLKARARVFLTDGWTLLALCQYVERSTGKHHYPEIAALLTIVNGIAGNEETVQPENLSKQILRLKRKLGPHVLEKLAR